MTEALTKPTLAAAARHLPVASGENIAGFSACGGLISSGSEGVLTNPVELKPPPFEIVFKTPRTFPAESQAAAGTATLGAILQEYRMFIAYGQDL